MKNSNQQQLTRLIDSLPKEISPNKDLWQDIEAQISAPTNSSVAANQTDATTQYRSPKSQYWRHLAAAASVGFVLLFGWLLTSPTAQNPSLEPITVTHALSNQSTEDLIALVDQIALTHQQQVNGFDDNKFTVGMQLDDLTNPFNKGYSELQLASKEIQKTLRSDPNNKQMWDLWLWVMKREIQLLQQQQRTPINTTPSTQGNTI
ncbi:anti-sigma factor [Shewanella sp. UCD-KL21]|uniref:anti-sigma factor n=1 Tax=Shewanella sp. UCD-KL21 TaxID=1917164 RepID=UPI000971371D|nr:anti-sigma factor [Shewanella sp. UCD-KL21]